VIGLAAFLCEIGVQPVLCASGGRSRHFAAVLRTVVPELPADTVIREGADFATIAAESETLRRMKLTPEDLAERRAAFKNISYHTVANAGHMLHHDQPEEVARLIEAFLV